MSTSSECSTYYLAGPMSGIPQANFPAFESASQDLRTRGLTIVNPTELDDETIRQETLADHSGRAHDHMWGEVLSRDVKLIADKCDGVVVLPGWDNSRGANLEVFVAITCGHRLFKYTPSVPAGVVPMTYAEAMQAINRRVFNL